MSEVPVVIGAGSIGQAIGRRVSAGKHVVLADLRRGNADAAAEVLGNAGQDAALATTPAEELLALPMLQPGQVTDPCTRTSWPSGQTRCA